MSQEQLQRMIEKAVAGRITVAEYLKVSEWQIQRLKGMHRAPANALATETREQVEELFTVHTEKLCRALTQGRAFLTTKHY